MEHVHDKPSSSGQSSKAESNRWTRVFPNGGRRPRPSWKQRQGEMPRARREQQSVTQVSLSSKLARYLGKEHGRELDSELSGVSWKWSPSQESLREDPMQVIKAASVV